MKKILLAFDGTHFSEGSFEFARALNEKQPILLTGVFVPLVNYSSLWSYATATAVTGAPVMPLLEDDEIEAVQQNIERFKTLCVKHHIEHRVHRDYNNFALPEIRKETRYADLLILGSETFYNNIGTDEPNGYLQGALQEAECPILIVPEKFAFPDSNVLAFDGSASSVYAIRQFAYLFPELTNNNTVLVFVNDGDGSIPDESYIEELASRHFTDLKLLKLELPSTSYFPSWLSKRKNSLLVSGAYGRSSFSQLFRRSFVTDIVRERKLPVFIAHRK
jgi:nucleotide-binding universal stress UspA family protein